MGLGALALLEVSDATWSALAGLIGGVIAAPVLLIVGAPFAESSTYVVAVAASAVLWMLLGVLASRRATRSPMAMWRDYWREYTWLAVGVVIGAIAALIASTLVLGESLL